MYNSCICFPHTLLFNHQETWRRKSFCKCNQLLIYWGNHCLALIFLDHWIFSSHLGVHSLETVIHKIVLLVVAAKRMKEEEQKLPNLYSGAHIKTYNSMMRMPKRAAYWHNWDWDLWKHWAVYKTLWNKWCDIVGAEKLSHTQVLHWWCQLWPQILVFYQLLYLLYWVSICQLAPHGLKGWYPMGLSKTTMMTWMQAPGLAKQGTALPGCLHPLWHSLHHNCSSCTAKERCSSKLSRNDDDDDDEEEEEEESICKTNQPHLTLWQMFCLVVDSSYCWSLLSISRHKHSTKTKRT